MVSKMLFLSEHAAVCLSQCREGLRSKSYLQILVTTEYQLSNGDTHMSSYFVYKSCLFYEKLLYEFSHG